MLRREERERGSTLAWVGAGVVYLLWRVLRHERRMPGYVGYAVGQWGI